MVVYVVYKMNYENSETGLDDNISFCSVYKNKRKAMKKAKELMRNAQKDDLFIDNYISGKKNPFKNNNWVDFYHDKDCQDDKVSSIVMEETKLIA